MKIGYLGTGAWGFCLASLLARKGYELICWSIDKNQVEKLSQGLEHPMLKGHCPHGKMKFTTDLEEAVTNVDVIVESVTSKGLRPVCESIKDIRIPQCPFIITSKGIEQNTGLILPEVTLDIFGEEARKLIGAISGPSFAKDTIEGLPTSVVGSGFNKDIMIKTCELFTSGTFRVYPNTDILGVCYGGALKNIIAIACGISGGLQLGNSCNAALMTRGLHEIRKLAVSKGCRPETLYGLSGMGDLCLTCGSIMSRNYKFGSLLAEGNSPDRAREIIGMVVEGAYTCVSALQLSQELGVSMPITEMVHKIVYENFKASEAVEQLMQRAIKEEHL
ncbi:MAG: NAD(P)H-dependent glycerol-3-phosphate dehydrogenase [Chlamydiota bacterium]|nr:NAD(P)H-dependent glycerol-3-phosphate dehydrogenase [Chlamydiota bacterium]